MGKYVCPLCNKIYYNVNDLATCTSKDAKAINERETEIKANERKCKELNKEIKALRAEIEKDYTALKTKVRDYNRLGIKLIAVDPNSDVHCATTLTFSDSKNNVFDRADIKKNQIDSKPKSKVKYDINAIDLTNLDQFIDDIFDF